MVQRRAPSHFWVSSVVALSTQRRIGALVALLAAAGLVGCSSGPKPAPELRAIWREYEALPDHRALAVAGQLRRSHWVAAASGGHKQQGDAIGAALRECGERRKQRRMRAPCQVYAVGDKIVRGERGQEP